MPRKKTFAEVKEVFEDRGYELLETEYVNSREHMKYKCPKHPDKDLKIQFNALKQGKGCPYCGGVGRYTYEEVKEKFSESGFKLLEKEYRNQKQKLRIECPKHKDKDNYMRFGDLLQGIGCKYCYNDRRKEIKRFDYVFVKEYFQKHGYTLLDKEYVNSAQKLRYVCPKHPDKINEIAFKQFKYGIRCPHCKSDDFGKRSIGAKNTAWKGGVNKINDTLRKCTEEWKRKILVSHNFKCYITGERSNKLEVHHAKPFHVIRDEVFRELGITQETLMNELSEEKQEEMVALFEEKHQTIKGYPVLKELHKQFHKLYGYKTTEEQFENFIKNSRKYLL